MNISGASSGSSIEVLVAQYMMIERQPINRLERQKEEISSVKSRYQLFPPVHPTIQRRFVPFPLPYSIFLFIHSYASLFIYVLIDSYSEYYIRQHQTIKSKLSIEDCSDRLTIT